MKKIYKIKKFESGQMMILVVFLVFAIAGMVALILDGGAIMANRRTAQAAADAGALAGAQRVCYGYSDGEAVANYYAIDKNGATSAVVSIVNNVVYVETTVQSESFFAKLFGVDSLTAKADASSGCFGPMGKSVIPLAWNCRAPSVGEPGPYPEEYGCQMQTLEWDSLEKLVSGAISSLDIADYDGNVKSYHMEEHNVVDDYGVPPEQIYIIFDSDKVCIEDDPLIGAIQCDLDGDGKKDLQVAGDRGWLYLTADTSNIGDWVDEGPHPNITIDSHSWLSGKSGVVVSVLNLMETHAFAGEVVLIPVYNVICDENPLLQIPQTCVNEAHASPPWPEFSGGDDFSEMKNSGPYYHIITFAPFYITCVDSQGNCPGYEYAQTLPKGSELSANEPVIEGFFLSDVGVVPDITQGCKINLGNCTISLGN